MSHSISPSGPPSTCARWRLAWIVVLTMIGSFVAAEAAHAAYPVKLKVTLERINGLDCTDENEVLGGCGSHPDFYARMYFDGSEVLDTEDKVDDDNPNITPTDWSAERSVDLERGKVTVAVQVRDQDGGFRGPADPIDITPGDGRDLSFEVNLAPCALSGGLTAECTADLTSTGSVVSAGSADDRAELTLKVEVVDADTDGDALLDGWETRGLDTNGDTAVDVDLPSQGADPKRHDLFVEVDCMVDEGGDGDLADESDHSHCPLENALSDVVLAFANAPGGPRTTNPDGTRGVQLHIDTGPLYGDDEVDKVNGLGGAVGSYGDLGNGGDRIAETAANRIIDWDGATGRPATSFYALKRDNFDARRRYAYRYAIFAHQTNNREAANDCTSGWAEDAPANDFFVTLGGLRDDNDDGTVEGPCWTATAGNGRDDDGDGRVDEDGVDTLDNDGDGRRDEDGANLSVGSRDEQAGTFMHELGHAVGLEHGGDEDVNRKPNYLSVMSYAMQPCDVPASPVASAQFLAGGCDFSRAALPALEERLDGASGLAGLDECRGLDGGFYGFGPANWNANTLPGGGPLFEGVSNCQAPNSANVSVDVNGDGKLTNLHGYDDWSNIFYAFHSKPTFANGVADPIADEPDPEDVERARRHTSELLAPDLAVDKTGPAGASPGESVEYALAVANNGSGPAFGVSLSDTKPDGDEASFAVGFMEAGAAARRTVRYDVPCTARDGSVLTDTAVAAGVDLLGIAETSLANNTDRLSTTVHAPVLTLAKTATSPVRAGEAITYRLTYENAGSGAAGSVKITDTLPAGVYYSSALDTGAGPAPDSVARHGDGTTTLTWDVGRVAGDSGPIVIEYTARPSLLLVGGSELVNAARLTFTNANGCEFDPVAATRTATIATAAATLDPLTQGYWRNHEAQWTGEILARIQASDQRYDGADGSRPDGRLSAAEVEAALAPGGTPPTVLSHQLLATYFNLATRRVNAATTISSRTDARIGVANVRAAALYAIATLRLPSRDNAERYSDAIRSLDEINMDRSVVG